MWYLLGEILILLVAAMVIGVGVGWLLWRWRRVSVTSQEFARLMADRTELYQLKMTARQERQAATPRPQPIEFHTAPSPEAPATAPADDTADATPAVAEATTVPSSADLGSGADATDTHDVSSAAASGSSPGDDDLTAISGIGPNTAQVLTAHGFGDYRRIGSMSEADIDRIEALLPLADRRIRSDDWVGQARHLFNEKVRQSLQ